jgi:hypothetical protein
MEPTVIYLANFGGRELTRGEYCIHDVQVVFPLDRGYIGSIEFDCGMDTGQEEPEGW